MEIAEAEELFNFPLHPYTHSLISAIPLPDPKLEKHKELFIYDPSVHDYSEDQPELVDIGHNHFVFGNKKEIEEYKALREKNVPLKTITILDPESERAKKQVKEGLQQEVIKIDETEIAPIHDTGSFWYKLISFILPLVGVIMFFLFKNKKHYRNARACLTGVKFGLITLAVILLLFVLSLILVVI